MATELYINASTGGSDSNDGLSPLTPFLTAQHAFEVARDNYGQDVVYNFAAGTYAGIIAEYSNILGTFKGDGSSNTNLGGIQSNAISGSIDIYSDKSIQIGSIFNYAISSSGGSIIIHNAVIGIVDGDSATISANGGYDSSYHGYDGGIITLYNCSGFADMSAIGTNGDWGGDPDPEVPLYGGNGGNISIYNSDIIVNSYNVSAGTGVPPWPNGSIGTYFNNRPPTHFYYNIDSSLENISYNINASLENPYKYSIESSIVF